MPLRKEDFEEALVEFKKLRNFRHRNVVEAIAYCKEPAMFGKKIFVSHLEFFHLVMEYMAGGTITGWLHDGNNKHTPMNWFQGLALLTDIARGVKLLHDTSLLHGDLSSNNVLLTGDHTTAKISDFGTVQMIEK
jgi:serine/threonine protein kinase